MKVSRADRLEEQLSRLARSDPLRAPLEALLDHEPQPPDGVKHALWRLEHRGKRSPRSVSAAADYLGEVGLSPEQRVRALAALKPLANPQLPADATHYLSKGLGMGFTAAASLLFVPIYGWLTGELTTGYPPADAAVRLVFVLAALAVIPAGAIAGRMEDRRAWLSVREAALHALGRLDDVDSVDLIASACLEDDAAVRRAGREALGRMLPGLTEERYGLLGPQVVPLLCRCLRECGGLEAGKGEPEPALAIAVLNALGRFGSGLAVAAVSQVAERARDESLRARAQEVLPVLQARRDREHEAETLLRPAPEPAADMLLRPAGAAPDSPPDRLLRPADEGQQDRAEI